MTVRGQFICVVAASGALLLCASAQPAEAQNIFQRLFGGFHHHASPPTNLQSFTDPFTALARAIEPPRRREGGDGPATAFCVRSCDGFHFTVHASPGASAAQMCHAFCPGSETRLYSGSNIDTATASDGSRYADLDTADAYQKQLVAGCTCNGHDVFGLAHIDAAADPTLKPGDVVAAKDGLMAFTGTQNKTAEFTPAASYPRFSRNYRDALAALKIAPPGLAAPDTVTSSIPPSAGQTNESRSAAR
jgi:hypothetical protein